MISPNEEEKLTLSSRKGYDKKRSCMPDTPEFEEKDNPSEPHENEPDSAADNRQQEGAAKKETEKKNASIADIFRELLKSVKPDKGGTEDKIFKTVIEAVTEATAKNKNPNKAIAEALSIFLVPEKPKPQATDPDSVDTEQEETRKTQAAFETILDTAESVNLKPKEILDELAGIAEERNETLPKTDDARYEAFEQHVKDTLDDPTKKTLEALYEHIKKLRSEIANDSSIDERMFDKVVEAETLLAEVAEVKEDKATREFLDLQEQEFYKKFAQVIVTVYESAAGARFGNLTAGKDVNLRKEEQQRADHLIKLLLAGNDPKEQKEELVAALLTSYPVEGTGVEQQEAVAMRKRIMGYAKLAGLDEQAIVNHQAIIAAEETLAPTRDLISDLDSEPALNAFERRVEQQITNASAADVRRIQDTWRELLESVDPNSETAAEAREAIEVLDNIIDLKEMQAARDRGEDVDFSTLPAPKKSKDAENATKESVTQSEADKELAVLLAKLFSPLRKGDKAEDYALVSVITDFILASGHSKEEKEVLLADLAACFPQMENTDESKDISSYLRIYADDLGLAQPAEDAGTAEKERHEYTSESLQKLIEEALAKVTHKDLIQLKGALGFVAIREKPTAEIKEQISQTIAFINALPSDKEKAKRADASQRPVEKPEKAAKKPEQKEEVIDKDAQREKELQLLKDTNQRIGPIAQDKDFEAFLQEVTEKLSGEKVPVEQLASLLKELDEKAERVRGRLRSEITDNDTSAAMSNKALMAFGFESGIDKYKKFLLREMHTTVSIPEGMIAVPQPVVENLLEQTQAITAQEAPKFDVDHFQEFLSNLEVVLQNPLVLSEQDLANVYHALLAQDSQVLSDLVREGKFTQALALSDQTRALGQQLYSQLEMISPDKLPHVEKDVKAVVQEQTQKDAKQRGDVFSGQVVNLGPTVVEAPVGSRYHEPGTRFQLGQAIEDIRSVTTTPDVGLPANLGATYTEVATRIKNQPEFSNTSALENRLNQLTTMIDEGLRAGVSLAAMPQAQALARQIQAQRQEIAVMEQMYKGRNDERSYKAEDIALYEGYVHTALGERIRRIQIELEIRSGVRSRTYVDSSGNTQTHKVRTDEELMAYYTELRKWAKILLKNDVRNNAGKAGEQGALNLSNDRYKRFSAIAKALPETFDLANAADVATMLGNVNYMFDKTATGGDFLRYFMRNTKNPKGIDPEKYDSKDFNPDELLGIDYRHAEGTSSFGLPKSLEDTCAIIARQYSSEKSNYKTGGNRELIDGEGNFKFNNFYYWIREQINADVLYNKDGQINPMQKINLKGDASSVSLAELLILVPEYLSQRNFEIQVDKDGDVVAGWGRQTEHPDFTWEQAQQLGAEVEFRQMTHEVRIQYVQASLAGDKAKFLQLMEALHKSNHWVRANNIMWLLGLPSAVTNGTQEIMDVVGAKEAQGTLGKAISDMLVGYSYINEIAHYYETPDKKAKGGKREKTFNENMFYRFWEANGANKFLTTMAEEALNNYDDAKKAYGTFLQDRLRAVAASTRSLVSGDAAKVEKLDTQLKDQIDAIQAEIDNERNVGIAIRFAESKQIEDFMRFAEKDILGKKFRTKKAEDEYFKTKSSDDVLNNLKGGFFSRLVNMQVHELDTITDKTGKKKDRPDTYLFLRAKDKKVRFGDINFGGQKIEDLLNGFDVNQIKRFNYTNKEDDPLNPFARYIKTNDEAGLRRAMDEFMDKDKNPDNYKLFKANEKMMLAFLKHVTRIDRGWLNHFRDIPENEVMKNMEKRAMEETVQLVHGVDSEEATYAWWQARDYIYIWGIGDWLDDTGIGFRTGGKLFHTGKWRAHRGGKDGGGNPHTFDEIGAVALPFLHTIQIHDLQGHQELGHQSIFSLLQGGHGYQVQPRALRSFKPRSRYSIAHDSEELYVANMLSNAADLADLLSTTEVDFTNIVSTDALGNIVFDYGKARELFKKWRKAIRYAYQKNGLDYREKIWVDGQEKTLYEYFFGKKTRAINQLITKETGRTEDVMYRDTADAVMASIIAAEIYEHRKMHLSGHHWTIENVIELEQVIREFMQEWDLEEDGNRDPHVKMKGNAFTRKVFRGAMKAYHTGYDKMYLSELNSGFWAGLFGGLFSGLSAAVSKGKWIY